MKLLLSILCLLAAGLLPAAPGGAPAALAAEGAADQSAANGQIERIKQERKRLARVRKQLERQLGSVGRELRELDAALIEARKASRAAEAQLRATDRKLAELRRRSDALGKRINTLKQAVLDQAAAAWRRSSHASPWMGVLTGVPVSDIPHRRYLLYEIMRSEERDRAAYAAAVAELAEVQRELQTQRQQLVELRRQKKQAAAQLAARVSDKRRLIKRVRKQMRAKKRRDRQLAREERALMRMLQGMDEELVAIDRQQAVGVSIRKRKGRLKWPIRGRIVASYRSRPKAGMARLQGVQLRPARHVKTVRAMAAGQVRYADWFGGYGLMMIVDYGDGLLGVYAHNDVLYKQLGDWVEEGETIADAGSTGWVNRVTLYFEVRDRGRPVNPKRWCRR